MSVFFDITHTTTYRYAQPVEIGEHRVMFRPRDSHDLRVLATDLQVTPPAQDIRMIQDVYSNSIAVVTPASPVTELTFVCTFTVEHTGSRGLDLPLDKEAELYPFKYSAEDLLALRIYLRPFYDDGQDELRQWAQQFINKSGSTGTRDLLVAMNQHIRDTMRYEPRDEEGVQTPLQTLQSSAGTCRDFATLMIEAVRMLGYAARFVSGYVYTANLDPGLNSDQPNETPPAADSAQAQLPATGTEPPASDTTGGGATHAWLQIYLPGAGWIPFDPTNNLVGGTDLIRVGVARHASLASPITGTWHGKPEDYLGMHVDVQVHKRS